MVNEIQNRLLTAWLKAEEKGAVAVEYAVVAGIVVVIVVGALLAATPNVQDAIAAAIDNLMDFIGAY